MVSIARLLRMGLAEKRYELVFVFGDKHGNLHTELVNLNSPITLLEGERKIAEYQQWFTCVRITSDQWVHVPDYVLYAVPKPDKWFLVKQERDLLLVEVRAMIHAKTKQEAPDPRYEKYNVGAKRHRHKGKTRFLS